MRGLPTIHRNEASLLIGFICGVLQCYVTFNYITNITPDSHDLDDAKAAAAAREIIQQRFDAVDKEAGKKPRRHHLTGLAWPGHDDSDDYENATVADVMANSVRILCLVVTTKNNHHNLQRASCVKETWGKRCTKLIFASDADDEKLGAIAVTDKSGANFLWGKVKAAFKHTYAHHLNDFDWFLRADDDTYIVMENLRLTLSSYSPDEPLFMGRRIKAPNPQGYMSGGAGYVLSRKALEKFVTEALRTPRDCKTGDDIGNDDVEMGKCLQGVGVGIADSRDSEGHQRFFPFNPTLHLTEHYSSSHWLLLNDYYPTQTGPDCCGDSAISFNHMSQSDMFLLEYTLYHVKPFGVSKSYDAEELKTALTKNGYKVVEKSDVKPIHTIHWPTPNELEAGKNKTTTDAKE